MPGLFVLDGRRTEPGAKVDIRARWRVAKHLVQKAEPGSPTHMKWMTMLGNPVSCFACYMSPFPAPLNPPPPPHEAGIICQAFLCT